MTLKRRFFLRTFLVIATSALLLFLFRYPLMLQCAKIALRPYLSSEGDTRFAYSALRHEEKKLFLEGVYFEDPSLVLRVDRIAVSFSFDHGRFLPEVEIFHPEISTKTPAGALTTPPHWLLSLIPSTCVHNGVLNAAGQRSYFSLERTGTTSQTLCLFTDPARLDAPLLSASLEHGREQLRCTFVLQQIDPSRFPSLLPFLSKGKWDIFQGEMRWEGTALFSATLALQSLESRFSGSQLCLENKKAGWKLFAEQCEADIHKGETDFQTSIFLSGGKCSLFPPLLNQAWEIEEIHGSLEISPNAPLSLLVHADLKQEKVQWPIQLEASCPHEEGRWEGSLLTGRVGELQLEARTREGEIDFSLEGPLASMLQLGLLRPPATTSLATLTGTWKQASGELTASLQAQEIECTFGLDVDTSSLSITEGWFRCEKINQDLWYPYLPELSFRGTVSVLGTFGTHKLHLCLQGQELLFDHPLLRCSASLTDKGALLQYDGDKKSWKGSIPLREAFFHHKGANLTLEGLETTLQVLGQDKHWELSAPVHADRLTLSDHHALEQLRGSFFFDSECKELLVEEGEAQLALPGNKEYQIRAGTLHLSASSLTLEASLFETGNKKARVCASASQQEDGSWGFSAESRGTPHVTLQGRYQEGIWHIDSLQADHLHLKAAVQIQKDSCLCTECQATWDNLLFNGQLSLAADERGVHLVASPLCIEASLPGPTPLALKLESQKKIQIDTYEKGLWKTEGLDFKIHSREGKALGRAYIDELSYSTASKEARFRTLSLHLPHDIPSFLVHKGVLPQGLEALQFPDGVQGTFDLTLSTQGSSLQGSVKEGLYTLLGKQWPLSHIGIAYDAHTLRLRCKTALEETPLFAQAQIDFSSTPQGVLKISDTPKADGMRLLFAIQKNALLLQNVQGTFSGIDADLTHSTETDLSGRLSLDMRALKASLPKAYRPMLDAWGLGKGFTLQGTFRWKEPISFCGSLLGENCELLGYELKSCSAHLFASTEKATLSQLVIDDPAGSLHMDALRLHKEKEGWHLNIPALHVQKLRPSLLHTASQSATSAKPLIVHSLSLSHITGLLGPHKTLCGSGSVRFTNASKKGTSLFEAPLEMLKDLGLDPGLFTPVEGEASLELHGDKFYVTALKDVHSDASRSEFYLAYTPEGSYVDLEGNLHIDLKMRQNVVLKVTEPFTLAVRGTLKKPKYTLQK